MGVNLENILEKHGVYDEDNFIVEEEADDEADEDEEPEEDPMTFEAEAKQKMNQDPKVPIGHLKKNRELVKGAFLTSNLEETDVEDSDTD